MNEWIDLIRTKYFPNLTNNYLRKTLNRNANYLLALNAFFDLLQLTHPFPFFVIALSGNNFIGTFRAFCLILPSIFGIQCSLTAIACTGFDRLFSVLFPIQYHQVIQKGANFFAPRLKFFYQEIKVNNLLVLGFRLFRKVLI